MFNAPEIFANVPDIAKIYEINDKQIDEVENAATQLDKDIFFETMGEERIARWEKMLGITPPDNYSVEDRRIKVHAKVLEKLPYTYRTLLKKMDVFCGKNNYIIKNDYNIMHLHTYFNERWQMDELKEMLDRMLPLNIYLDYLNTMIFQYDLNLSALEKAAVINMYLHTQLEEYIKNKVELISLKTSLVQTEELEATVTTKKNAWYFDGTFLLNGEKQFNAEVNKEVL